MQLLIAHGAEVNLSSASGYRPLHYGAIYPEVAAVLLRHGADPNAPTDDGATPLMAMDGNWNDPKAVTGQGESVRLLLNAGAKPDVRSRSGATPLITAAINGNVDGITQLLRAAADINRRDQRGRTALAYVRQQSQAFSSPSGLMMWLLSPSLRSHTKALRNVDAVLVRAGATE